MGDYCLPQSLTELRAALSDGKAHILAGGTDFYPQRVGQPLPKNIVDITNMSDLKGIRETDDFWHFGAITTWRDILDANLPLLFDGLKTAAREVGGQQVQNAGTIGGNLCNASPAADGVPVFLSLGASVELSTGERTRTINLADFITGNRKTVLRSGEILTAVLVPKTGSPQVKSLFLKLGARKYLVISMVMVAIVVEMDEAGIITTCRIAIGACSEVAMRLDGLEQVITGREKNKDLAALVTADHLAALAPVTDVRASREYRLDAALTLVRRALDTLGRGA
ncbi:xanthine dehydrogenase family protein subunit M [Sneathiella sp.]|uniref:FAD binding domain-containing protein n=1 Tax=Sneathiella sp. TaxID=1964365 RepID=UPI0035658F8D